MLAVVEELDRVLKSADAQTAERLETQVRELIESITKPAGTVRGKGRPPGYFEKTYGSFRDEPLERPEQLPIEKREEW
jgi:hypothetical protein